MGLEPQNMRRLGAFEGPQKKRFRKTRCFQAGYIDDIYIYLAFLRISNRGSEKFLSIWRMLCPNRC
jgi:hypothetical protein